jgi:hypothetical protein
MSQIGLQGSRIGSKIFSRAELVRIHENADNNGVAVLPGLPDET